MSDGSSKGLTDLIVMLQSMQTQVLASTQSNLYLAVDAILAMNSRLVALESRVEELENRLDS